MERAARLPFHCGVQKTSDPVALRQGFRLAEDNSGAHGQQVLHGHTPQPAAGGGRQQVLKEIRHLVLQVEDAVVDEQAHRQGDHRLAGGEGVLGGGQHLAAEGRLAQDLAMAQDQNILHVQVLPPGQFLQEFADVVRGDALGLRRSPGKGLLGQAEGQRLFLPVGGQEGLRPAAGVQEAGQELEGAAGGGEIHRGDSFLRTAEGFSLLPAVRRVFAQCTTYF